MTRDELLYQAMVHVDAADRCMEWGQDDPAWPQGAAAHAAIAQALAAVAALCQDDPEMEP